MDFARMVFYIVDKKELQFITWNEFQTIMKEIYLEDLYEKVRSIKQTIDASKVTSIKGIDFTKYQFSVKN